MNNYKIKASVEAVSLFCDLGYDVSGLSKESEFLFAKSEDMSVYNYVLEEKGYKELTLPQLRDLVAQSKSNVREYLDPNDNYKLCLINPSDAAHWMIEVPEGTEVVRRNLQGSLNFYKKIDGHWALKNKVDMDNWYQPKPYSSHFDADNGSLPVVWKREPTQEQALISGADALRALADGKEVEYLYGENNWLSVIEMQVMITAFTGSKFKFRLKPRTITLSLEIPSPFEPKDGEEAWCLDGSMISGYKKIKCDDFIDSGIGFWRTEEEIKQVVAALRGIKG